MQIYSFLYLISACLCLFFCTGMAYGQLGHLDTNFGTDGIAKTIISPADDQSLTVYVLPDDRFLVAGYSTIETDNRGFSMVMYNPNGDVMLARYIGDHSLGTGKVNIVQNKLMHIYPNPSSNKLTIEYHLDFPDRIYVNLFNLLGENIKLLINEEN